MRDYEFGNLIYSLRKRKNLTQKQLGEILNVSDKTVSKWETGATKPNVETLYLISNYFEISVDDLVKGKEAPKAKGSGNKKKLSLLLSAVNSKAKAFFTKNKKPIIKWSAISVAGLAVLFGVAALLYYMIPISVPDVVGCHVDAAASKLEQADFKTNIIYQYSDTVAENIVISKDTKGREKLKRNSAVDIIVSQGIEKIKVPSVMKLEAKEAEKKLLDLGFKVTFKECFSDEIEKGKVAFQSVAGGNKIYKGSIITLSISKGPDLAEVPNVLGKTDEAAIEALQKAGFTVETEIKCSSSVKEGRIVAQSVSGGTMHKKNEKITLVVSAGVANTRGNTNSNAVANGIAAVQGNWTYYSNLNYDFGLYKMRNDGSEKQILANGVISQINVVGEWIYYNDTSQTQSGTYKIRIDGSQKTRISSCSYWMTVIKDDIYFTNSFSKGAIYKMDTEGKNKALICSDKASYINVIGDWIYYINEADRHIYKIRTNGNDRKIVNAAVLANNLVGEGEFLFCADDHGDFYKIGIRSNECIKYKQAKIASSWFINESDGKLYYLYHDTSEADVTTGDNIKSYLCETNFNAAGAKKLTEISVNNVNCYVNVAKGWIYFPNAKDNDYIYRVKTDGTNLQKVYN